MHFKHFPAATFAVKVLQHLKQNLTPSVKEMFFPHQDDISKCDKTDYLHTNCKPVEASAAMQLLSVNSDFYLLQTTLHPLSSNFPEFFQRCSRPRNLKLKFNDFPCWHKSRFVHISFTQFSWQNSSTTASQFSFRGSFPRFPGLRVFLVDCLGSVQTLCKLNDLVQKENKNQSSKILKGSSPINSLIIICWPPNSENFSRQQNGSDFRTGSSVKFC